MDKRAILRESPREILPPRQTDRMQRTKSPDSGLDPWLEDLRRRFAEIARRRVPEDAVEDLVQDALRVVIERGLQRNPGELVDGRPAIAWCMTVLRNVIGNWYQHRDVRRGVEVDAEGEVDAPGAGPTPLEALASSELERLVRRGIDQLEGGRDRCSAYLRALAEGRSPAQLAAEEGVEAAILYRRVYRCRARLREWLAAKGVRV